MLKAAAADWTYVEPAIFGTLLERALDPRERHKLGAHYTPRAYVERLVLPTVIEPLRKEWQDVQTAALAYQNQNKPKQAVAEVRNFHQHLCELHFDPACGSGNFLYVTLEHMKSLEGEVLNLLSDLGETQGLLELQGVTVDPHQFLGLEINPRAARIAEMVLWIGYLQWHYRTHGKVNPPEPVLRDFNINRDACSPRRTSRSATMQAGHSPAGTASPTNQPVTGERAKMAQIEQYRYINRRLNIAAVILSATHRLLVLPPAPRPRRRLCRCRASPGKKSPSLPILSCTGGISPPSRAAAALTVWFYYHQLINKPSTAWYRRNWSENPLSLAFAIPNHPWVDGDCCRAHCMTVG